MDISVIVPLNMRDPSLDKNLKCTNQNFLPYYVNDLKIKENERKCANILSLMLIF